MFEEKKSFIIKLLPSAAHPTMNFLTSSHSLLVVWAGKEKMGRRTSENVLHVGGGFRWWRTFSVVSVVTGSAWNFIKICEIECK